MICRTRRSQLVGRSAGPCLSRVCGWNSNKSQSPGDSYRSAVNTPLRCSFATGQLAKQIGLASVPGSQSNSYSSATFKAADLQRAQVCATSGCPVNLALEILCPVCGGSICLITTSL
jgi:hypothetical protein